MLDLGPQLGLGTENRQSLDLYLEWGRKGLQKELPSEKFLCFHLIDGLGPWAKSQPTPMVRDLVLFRVGRRKSRVPLGLGLERDCQRKGQGTKRIVP